LAISSAPPGFNTSRHLRGSGPEIDDVDQREVTDDEIETRRIELEPVRAAER